MKKTFSVVVGLFMLLMLPLASFSAGPGPYINANLGMSFLMDSDFSEPGATGTIEFDTGFATSFAAGYNFGMFRVEGEIGYQFNDIDQATVNSGGRSVSGSVSEGDMTAFSLMANGYFDFVNTTPFTPFISAGLGVATLEINDLGGFDSDDTVFAYQFGVGVGYAINQNFNIDLTYRYFATEDPDFGVSEAEFASNNLYLGLRYNF
jgi:opacity protein-like surface antigen